MTTLKVDFANHGSGGIYTISGNSEHLVSEKAKEMMESIDYYRSPVLTPAKKAQDNLWTASIKYYGLD